ncbi:Cell divisionFtsK/SpoIIIE (plasmid) [Calothrix sp. PCC 7716]|nr:Cell divisionFtsK/SpoIIIE [Calothrix sp. PCC 7716]
MDSNSLIVYVNNARAAGYSSQQIIETVEATGNIAATSYVSSLVQQLEFRDKLCRTTIKYDQNFLYESIYGAVLSGMANDDILHTCGEYCDVEDYAFCKLALHHILVHRVPSEAEIAAFLMDLKNKFTQTDSVFNLIKETVNEHFLSLIRKAFLEWYIYPAFVQGKDINFFLSLADKCGDIIIADYCRRTADKISIQKHGIRLDLKTAGSLASLTVDENTIPVAEIQANPNQPSIDEAGKLLVEVLKDFKIEAELVGAVSGPTFNRIEVKLGRGVKFGSVANFSDDLMQQLGDELGIDKAPMITSIKGRTAFDIPKFERETAYFRDYADFDSQIDIQKILIPGGIDVNGQYYKINFCDDNSPHVMGGGRTRSGKSQFLKSGIMYLARRYPPSVVRMVLSDVKRVTFGKFKNLPHLIGDVCKDAQSTADMLDFLVAEMELRYQEFEQWEDSGIENINQYNKLHSDNHVMPRIICWIDEISELLSDEGYSARIEKSLASLLRKAGAAGIHVGAYTQRPDAGALKPQIRSNFPAKTAFAVARPEDSKIILGDPNDERAKDLLGRGDFILRTPEVDVRLQALYLDDADDIEYFNQIMEEIINAADPYTAWDSGLDFDEFIEQLYLNKDTTDPHTVDRIVTNNQIKNGKNKTNFDSSFKFSVELDARAKDTIQTLWRRGYDANQITAEVFGKSKGGRDGDRKFEKNKKVVEKHIAELELNKEVKDDDI